MPSIVDIVTADVRPLEGGRYDSLTWNFDTYHSTILIYTPEFWKLFIGNPHTDLTGGPLEHPHSLYEIHGHWKRIPEHCRVHTVDQYAYDGELHFSHTNTGLACHPINAKNYTDPRFRAVICIFLKKGRRNEELSKITDKLHPVFNDKPIQYDGTSEDVDPAALFPENLEYWTYDETWGTVDEAWEAIDYLSQEATADQSQEATGDQSQEATGDLQPYPETFDNGQITYIILKTPIEVSEEQLEVLNPSSLRDAAGRNGPPYNRTDIREGVGQIQE